MKTKIFPILLCISFRFLSVNALEDTKKTVIVELNDFNAAASIKSQLIDYYAKDCDFQTILPFIDVENSTLMIEGLDVSRTGTIEAMIHLSLKMVSTKSELFFHPVKDERIRIQVIDSTAPSIILKYAYIELNYAQPFHPEEWISSIQDNSLQNIELSIDSENFSSIVPGEHRITYYATDVYGNTGSQTLTVKVKKPYSQYGMRSELIDEMLNLMNQERNMSGLPSLSLGDENAQQAIGIRACEAVSFLSHTRPDGSHYKTAFDEYHVEYKAPYEILTCAGNSVQDKFNWWMNSPDHQQDILRQDSTKVAIGYCDDMWAAIIYQ